MGYEGVEHDLWDHPAFQAVSTNAKILYLWAWTCSRSRLAGVFRASTQTIRTEAGLTARAVTRALAELGETMLRHYEPAGLWWAMPKAKRARSPQQLRGAMNQIADIKDAGFRSDWSAAYPDLIPDAWRYPMDRVSALNGTEHDRTERMTAVIDLSLETDARARAEALVDRLRRRGMPDRDLVAHAGNVVNLCRDVAAGRLPEEVLQYAVTQNLDDRTALGKDGKPLIRVWWGRLYGILEKECAKRGVKWTGNGGPA